jgi:fibronectin type 3 domain-containing protein
MKTNIFKNMNKKIFSSKLLTLCIAGLLLSTLSYTQQLDMLRPAPEGMFVYLSGDLATGKKADQYIIERSNNKQWNKVAELKSPATWDEFKTRLEQYKKDFPFSNLPETKTLQKLWNKAYMAGTIDSMYMWSTSPLIRLASATAYYDKQAPKNKEVSYRVTMVAQNAKKPQVYESKPSKWPIFAAFDSVYLEDRNVEKKLFYLKWKSTGNQPAPNFKVQYYDNKQLKTAGGIRTIYKVKETTYYIYQDSIKQTFTDRQFFMVPIDYLGNISNPSKITFVSSNVPEKRYFKKAKASTAKDMLGVKLSWQLNDTHGIKSIEVYRSTNFDKGFENITSCPPTDTTFTDIRVEPDKFYYYYLRANEMYSNDVVESSKFFDVGKDPLKPNAPVIDYAIQIPKGIELKITVSDVNLAGVRIYRRNSYNGQYVLVSDLIKLKSGSIVWKDTSDALIGNQTFAYVARTENTSSVLSNNSKEVISASGKSNPPREVSRFSAYEENKKVILSWESLSFNDIAIKGYTVYRREMPKGKFKPVYPKDSISESNMFTDSLVTPGKTYEYGVRTVDRFGGVSEKLALTSIQISSVIISPPNGLKVMVMDSKALLGWNTIVNKEIRNIKIYRYQRGKKPVLLTSLPTKEYEYTDASVKKGELYFYYITVVNKDNMESTPSKEVSIKL